MSESKITETGLLVGFCAAMEKLIIKRQAHKNDFIGIAIIKSYNPE
jgi:hypothetical protein